MECTGLVVFNIETKEPVLIKSILTRKKDSHGDKLRFIAKELQPIVEQYKPTICAIERGFSRYNTATQIIYMVHGLILYLFSYFCKKEIYYYPPKKVKKFITNGNASKKEVQEILMKTYPNITFKNEDESDAFAVGITYFISECDMEWYK